jgi:hypothetical protein
LRWIRHVEDREDRPLAILNELIEGFRLDDVLDPIDCLDHSASAKDFVAGIGVHDGFEHHPHDNLQIGPANSPKSGRRPAPLTTLLAANCELVLTTGSARDLRAAWLPEHRQHP